MKANELRIGNLIGCDIQTLIVKAVNDETVICHTMGGKPYTLYFEDVYGLKLTEEWLVKFGFVYKSYGYGDSEWKQWWFNGYFINGFRCATSNIEIKSVNQLQNLYFALTGEELTLQQ